MRLQNFGRRGTNHSPEQFHWREILADFWNNIKYQIVTKRRQNLLWRIGPRRHHDAGRNGAIPALRRFALPIMVLLPWIALGTVLLRALDTQARDALESEAQMRASAYAALLDQQIRNVIVSIERSWIASKASGDTNVASTSGSDVPDFRSVGLNATDGAFTVITPASVDVSASAALDALSLSTAKAALATKTPRVASYVDGAGVVGLNLWLPFFKNDEPILLQSRLPASTLSASLQYIVSRGPWDMTVTDSDGTVLANFINDDERGSAAKSAFFTSMTDFAPDGAYITATSELSPFGFRVRAMTLLASIEEQSRRNWISFFIVTCMLTAVTLAADRTMFQKRVSKDAERQPDSFASKGLVAGSAAGEHHRLEEAGSASSTPALDRARGLNEERLHQALVAGGICIWEWRRTNSTIIWENSPATLLRQSGDVSPPSVRALIRRTFPHERRRVLHSIRIALADGRPLSIDVRLTCFDGEPRWIALRANPIRNDAGHVIGFVGTANDVTDQKRGLSRTDALLREVSHRSKNMLALILAMARLTARDAIDVKSHLKEFALRVAGLSASQDLIVAAEWQSVDLTRLASAEIEAVARSDASRVKISGPPVLVTPEAAQTLGMILTELALNAMAHGALSAASGEVVLSWAFPNASTIRISWREVGGPAYDANRSKGYGLSVIERFSAQGLKLDSRVTSDGDNVTWTLEGPLAHIGMHSTPRPA